MLQKAPESADFQVVEGGKVPLAGHQLRAVSHLADLVRGMTPAEVDALVALVHEFSRDRYLSRVRTYELPAVKILAEVINGWDADGVYEFARAWTSTLVAREDGFDWSHCTGEEKSSHCRRIRAEMNRRGM